MGYRIGDKVKAILDMDGSEVYVEIIEIHQFYLRVKEIGGQYDGVPYDIRESEIVK